MAPIMTKNIGRKILYGYACLSVVGCHSKLFANSQKSGNTGAISRVADVLEVKHLGDKKIRLIFSAQENNGTQRFPITTIDRSMVKVDFMNVSAPPADAESLMLNGSGGSELRRAMFVGFSLHRKLRSRAIEEVRADVGDLIKQLPSEMLTVAAIAQDSARVIADVTPQKSDNVNRISQQLQALEPEGEGPALADTLCVAAERFHAWDLSSFKKSDQKILIMLSTPGDAPSKERFRGQNCWRSLLDQGVRVFFVSFGESSGVSHFNLADVAQESGGYAHRVSGPVEMNAAVKNIIALLQNEYVVDVTAPAISEADQPLELKVRIAYHDASFESHIFDIGFVIPALAIGASPSAHMPGNVGVGGDNGQELRESHSSTLNISLWALGVTAFLGVAGVICVPIIKHRAKTTACSTCSLRVSRDHSDCPFRKATCVARLVYIGGPNAGKTIPLLAGTTKLSRFPLRGDGTAVLGRKIDWIHHGTITIEGTKAIYTPVKVARDRINGWLVNEPRLLGVGGVLRIGDQNLRFEMKQQTGVR